MLRIIFFLSFLFSLSASSEDWIERTVSREFQDYLDKGISQKCIEKCWKQVRKKEEFRRYKIINSTVYGQEGSIKNLLKVLVDRYSIPDVDFIYFYEDRIKPSAIKRKPKRYKAPILVSAKNQKSTQLICFSDWYYDPTSHDQGWNHILEKINQAQDLWDWEEKIDKLCWRGSPFDGRHFGMYNFENWKDIPRGRLVFESRRNPDYIDAAFSKLPQTPFTEDPRRCVKEMGPANFMSQEEQLKYKYHLLIDGVTCTFPGSHWKLLSGCVPFKQDSKDILYFYPELRAWEHYIPVKEDLSDLIEKIYWAKNHDQEVKEIAINAREFALTHLMPEHILEYCKEVLLCYASLQKFQPTLIPFDPEDKGRQF